MEEMIARLQEGVKAHLKEIMLEEQRVYKDKTQELLNKTCTHRALLVDGTTEFCDPETGVSYIIDVDRDCMKPRQSLFDQIRCDRTAVILSSEVISVFRAGDVIQVFVRDRWIPALVESIVENVPSPGRVRVMMEGSSVVVSATRIRYADPIDDEIAKHNKPRNATEPQQKKRK